MAISNPVELNEFMDLLQVADGGLVLQKYVNYSGLTDGTPLARIVAFPKFEARFVLGDISLLLAHRIEAVINHTTPMGIFNLYDPAHEYPTYDQQGTILGSASVLISGVGSSRDNIRLAGLPANYVLAPGDHISYSYGSPSRRALLEVAELIEANSAGQMGPIYVSPHVPVGTEVGLAVRLVKPYGRFFMKSFERGSVSGKFRVGMSMVAIQVPR